MTNAPEVVTSVIVGGPTPDEQGMVTFEIRVGDEVVIGVAHPCGSGIRDDLATTTFDVASSAIRTVSLFVEEHRDQMIHLYREAALLRRDAGNPPPAGRTRRGNAHLVGAPARMADVGLVFVTEAAGKRLRVAIFNNGGFDFVEECDDIVAISDEDRDEAVTVCFDYIFAHPDEATALGLDVALLGELWR